MYCNKCGTRLRKNSNFCHICGNKVSEVEIYIRKPNEPLPEQLNMGEFFEKPKFKKLETKENGFLEIIRSLRIKDNKPNGPINGDNEVALNLTTKFDKNNFINESEVADKETKIPDPLKKLVGRNKEEATDDKLEEIQIPELEIKNTPHLDLEEETKIPDSIQIAKEKKPSVFKRFFEYMREEEIYVDNILNKKTDKKVSDLDTIDAQIITDDSNLLEEKNLEESVLVESFEAEIKENLGLSKMEKTLIKEEKIEEIDEILTEKSPSPFKKLQLFLAEEDEDTLLDLSPEEYSNLIRKNQDDEEISIKVDIELEKEVNIPLEVEKKSCFFEKLIGVFSSRKNVTENELEKYEKDTPNEIENESSIFEPKYSLSDENETIRYSKTIIDSHLSKVENEIANKEEDLIIEETLPDEGFVTEEVEYISPEEKIIPKDTDSYENLILDLPDETLIAIQEKKKESKLKEVFENISENIKDFFKSITQFFSVNSQNEKNEKEKDNIDIILNSPMTSDDTMPLILSQEEKEILNKEIIKRQQGSKPVEALKKTNSKIAPIVRKMINLGAKLIVPLFIIILGGNCWTISWTVSNPFFIVILGLVKFFITYITISVATNAAFNSVGLRLKRSAVNLFIFLQMLIYFILDATYIRLTFIEGQTVEALLHVMSPKVISIAIFLFLAFMLLIFNYKKIKERGETLVFIGWYIVISTTITLVIILLELLISTILYSFFKESLFF